MDIVSRLKEFINYLAIPVTQFADTCKIPRPSLSQLLNGRNKKVSDELIGKIHEAFPELSVMWLMFGEGTMLFNSNIKTSEPQSAPNLEFSLSQPSDNETISATIDFNTNYQDSSSDNSAKAIEVNSPGNLPENLGKTEENDALPEKENYPGSTSPTISFNPTGGKSIVNIIVYYSDNSFESFTPSTPR